MLKKILIFLTCVQLSTVAAVSERESRSPGLVQGVTRIMGVLGLGAVNAVKRHPFISALGLWCLIYNRHVIDHMMSYGQNPVIFVPIVGTMLFYLSQKQHGPVSEFISSKDQLQLSLNLGNKPEHDDAVTDLE